MASQLKVDTLTGVTTAGSIDVTGEGNSTTTNLQQGLLKCTMDLDGSGTISLHDSFNISSVVDNATGTYTPSYTNGFANRFYGWGGSAETAISGQNGRAPHQLSDFALTGSTKIAAGYQFGFEDCKHIRIGWWGDLA